MVLGIGIIAWISSCFSAAACNLGFRSCHCGNSIATRVVYAIILLLNSILAWTMMSDWVVKKLEKKTHNNLHLNCPEGSCFGVLTVHRVCFALSLFHFFLGVLVIGIKDNRNPRSAIQNGWWGPKVLLWIGLIIGSFFIPNEFFLVWGNYISLIGAAIFILVGLVLLVDFAHTWSEKCMDKYDQSNDNKWKIILVGSTLLMFAGAIIMTSIVYAFFARSGCSINQFFITLNSVLCIIGTLLCIHPKIQEGNPRSGLPQASMVVIYCTYLILSAAANEPTHDMCNPLNSTHKTRKTSIIIGALFTFLAISYSTSRAASQGKALLMNYSSTIYKYHRVNCNDNDEFSNTIPLTTNESKDEQPLSTSNYSQTIMDSVQRGVFLPSVLDEEAHDLIGDENHDVAYNYTFFHFIFAIAAMYVAMLLTSWNTITMTGNEKLVVIGKSYTIVWVKVISGWVCFLLYYWSLVAPALFPDRFINYVY
ncbi:serine incorporator/TMS membrane protein [Glomus cerebriforme]|uniref:Serine incorporator/TMS membrane protein n=1 Tax=Glomus cerebriforme TaxID=658196 RepID=A0A397TQ30_9GLOM|nr:serine incorporator/TMS membrane protein [Glomus cerebriforme]